MYVSPVTTDHDLVLCYRLTHLIGQRLKWGKGNRTEGVCVDHARSLTGGSLRNQTGRHHQAMKGAQMASV